MINSNSQNMIEVRGLRRTYNTRAKTNAVEAVKGIDFTVAKGEIVGFLGPNGAGKTTTLKMLCTLLEPSDGEISIAGIDLRKDPVGVRRRIGYVSQSGSTANDAKAGDEIVWHAELYGLKPDIARSRGKELFKALDLDGMWDRKCASMSGGQRRRLDIAMGLIHQPELIFLDEPSTGLDPQSRANLWDHIRGLRDNFGTTIFLTTHYMDEADSLSDRLLVIDGGEIVGEGTPRALKAKVSGDTITLTLRTNDDAAVAIECANAVGADGPTAEGNIVRLQVENGAAALPKLINALTAKNVEAIGVEVAKPTLDDVFLNLTGRSLRD